MGGIPEQHSKENILMQLQIKPKPSRVLADSIGVQAKMHNYYQVQNGGAGWFFWTAKTENHSAPEWDYLYLLEKGIAPKNLCAKENLCSDPSLLQ